MSGPRSLRPDIPEDSFWAELVAQSTDVITIIDGTGVFQFQNPAIKHVLGYDREDLIGESALEYVHPDDHDHAVEAHTRLVDVETAATERFEHRFKHADGSWVWLETVGRNDPDSTIDGYVLNSREITERKHQERELDRTSRQLRSVIDSIESVVWMRDAERRYVLMNDHYRNLFDIAAEDNVVGKTPEDVVDEDLAETFRKHDDRAREAGELVTFEEQAVIGGEEVYALTKVTPLYDAQGDFFGTCGVAIDITEQRKREHELRERNKELNALHELSRQFATADGQSAQLLDAFVEDIPAWFQYPDRTAVRITFGDQVFGSGTFGGPPAVASTTDIDADTSVTVEVGWSQDAEMDEPFLGAEERLVETMAQLLSETIGRREQEQALDLFKQALEDVAHGVMIADYENVIEHVNPAFEEQTGYDKAELIGETPQIFRSGKHDVAVYEDIQSTIQSGRTWEGELVHRRRDGSLYYASVTISPMVRDGEVTHFVSIWTDITNRQIREQQLDVLNRLLRHNLRNSLTVIGGYATLIENEEPDDIVQESVDVIQHHVDRLEELSEKNNRVRSFTERGPIGDTRSNVSTILSRLETSFADTPADLSFSYPPEVFVNGPEDIEVAFEEVIENALVHNDADDPQITIRVEVPDAFAEIRISDNGPGIPEDQQRVFEQGIETPLVHGSGLGLWIAYWIVTQVGGELRFSESAAGGTEVVIRLPLVEE